MFKKWFPIFNVPSPRKAYPKELASPTSQKHQVAQQ
jgi:hypothetical protein